MISREHFIETIQKIGKQEERTRKFEDALHEMGDGHFVFDTDNQYLSALLSLLKAELHDDNKWIEWWLFEYGSDRTVTIKENDAEHTVDLTEPGALYDFLAHNAATIADERLPIRDINDDSQSGFLPRKAIAETDFLACFDSILGYLDRHDIALQIEENGIPKFVMLNKRSYDRMESLLNGAATAEAK